GLAVGGVDHAGGGVRTGRASASAAAAAVGLPAALADAIHIGVLLVFAQVRSAPLTGHGVLTAGDPVLIEKITLMRVTALIAVRNCHGRVHVVPGGSAAFCFPVQIGQLGADALTLRRIIDPDFRSG